MVRTVSFIMKYIILKKYNLEGLFVWQHTGGTCDVCVHMCVCVCFNGANHHLNVRLN